ncbi:MAG: hypothetical protein C0622_09380, partial [Desulfuromonas sp.]
MQMSRTLCLLLLVMVTWALGTVGPRVASAEDYSFDIEEFEKKPLTWGGYAELKAEHNRINTDGAFALLNYYDHPRSELDRLTTTLQLDGNYHVEIVDFNWLLQTYSSFSQVDDEEDLNIFSAYTSIKPTPSMTFELGKKTFKWGKGYAWNPVGFIDRPKDPNNPEDALEGYIGGAVDLIKSFPGKLQTVALTTVLLPVWDNVNEDFGERDNLNLAAKLYLLYADTDIDFILFTGNSRSTRFGLDLSKNLKTNFEVHAELAYIPEQKRLALDASGTPYSTRESIFSYLLGLRYLSENDITTILEYYHNDAGYSEEQMERFYRRVDEAHANYLATGDDSLLRSVREISEKGYAKPQAGRNYLYLRTTQKEPFDILYFTPGVTAIVNLDDSSYTVSPEAVYTGITDWEFRLRYSHSVGERYSEQGEKANESKLELR